MVTAIILLAGSLAVLFGLCYIVYKYGRISVLKEQAERSDNVHKKQAEIMANRPSALDSLRDGKF